MSSVRTFMQRLRQEMAGSTAAPAARRAVRGRDPEPRCEDWQMAFECGWPGCLRWVVVHADTVDEGMPTPFCSQHEHEGFRWGVVSSSTPAGLSLARWATLGQRERGELHERAVMTATADAYRHIYDHEGDEDFWRGEL